MAPSKGVSARRLRQRYQVHTHHCHLRPPIPRRIIRLCITGDHQLARDAATDKQAANPGLSARASAARLSVSRR